MGRLFMAISGRNLRNVHISGRAEEQEARLQCRHSVNLDRHFILLGRNGRLDQ